MSRSNPFPATELVSAPNWDIQVLEVKRGEEAWKEIQAANDFNVEAAKGMEYLLVKLHVKSTYADSEEHKLIIVILASQEIACSNIAAALLRSLVPSRSLTQV